MTPGSGVIADAFVKQSRFDPLHTAETEQLLLDRLTDWLAVASSRESIALEIEYMGISHTCRSGVAAPGFGRSPRLPAHRQPAARYFPGRRNAGDPADRSRGVYARTRRHADGARRRRGVPARDGCNGAWPADALPRYATRRGRRQPRPPPAVGSGGDRDRVERRARDEQRPAHSPVVREYCVLD